MNLPYFITNNSKKNMNLYSYLFSIPIAVLSLSTMAMDKIAQDGNNQVVEATLKQIQKALQPETKDRDFMRFHRDGNSPQSLRLLALKSCEPILQKEIEKDNINLLYQFFRVNIDPDYRLPNFSTGPMPLVVLATKKGAVKCLELLIKKGADLEHHYFFDTPLIIAADEGHLKCLKALIHAHVDLNNQRSHCLWKETALHTAASKGHPDCVRALLEAGADTECEAYCGTTPLMDCIPQWDNYETAKVKLQCAKLLIWHKANLDHTNSSGNTALMLAAEHGKSEFVELLLKAGARWDLRNDKGYNALQLVPDKDYSWYQDCKQMLQNIQQRHPALNFLWKLI